VAFKNVKHGYRVDVFVAAIFQVRSMFLEKLLVIETTYTATEQKLRVEEKSVSGNPIGNSLYTARNYFSLREITFLECFTG